MILTTANETGKELDGRAVPPKREEFDTQAEYLRQLHTWTAREIEQINLHLKISQFGSYAIQLQKSKRPFKERA